MLNRRFSLLVSLFQFSVWSKYNIQIADIISSNQSISLEIMSYKGAVWQGSSFLNSNSMLYTEQQQQQLAMVLNVVNMLLPRYYSSRLVYYVFKMYFRTILFLIKWIFIKTLDLTFMQKILTEIQTKYDMEFLLQISSKRNGNSLDISEQQKRIEIISCKTSLMFN